MSETTEHIKRPMNAFMVWSRNERRKLALKYPNMLNCEISKLLGAEWSRLSEEEKKPYVMEAKRLRTVHSQKYPDYSYKPRRRKNKAAKNREVYTSFTVPAPGDGLAPPGYGLPMATAPPPPMHYLSPVPTYSEPYLMPMISAPSVSTPKRPYLHSSFSIPSQPETKDSFHHSHLPVAAILPSSNAGYQTPGADRGDSSAVYSMQTSYYKSLFAQRCGPNGPFQPR